MAKKVEFAELLVTIEFENKELNKALDKAEQSIKKTQQAIDRSSQQSSRSITSSFDNIGRSVGRAESVITSSMNKMTSSMTGFNNSAQQTNNLLRLLSSSARQFDSDILKAAASLGRFGKNLGQIGTSGGIREVVSGATGSSFIGDIASVALGSYLGNKGFSAAGGWLKNKFFKGATKGASNLLGAGGVMPSDWSQLWQNPLWQNIPQQAGTVGRLGRSIINRGAHYYTTQPAIKTLLPAGNTSFTGNVLEETRPVPWQNLAMDIAEVSGRSPYPNTTFEIKGDTSLRSIGADITTFETKGNNKFRSIGALEHPRSFVDAQGRIGQTTGIGMNDFFRNEIYAAAARRQVVDSMYNSRGTVAGAGGLFGRGGALGLGSKSFASLGSLGAVGGLALGGTAIGLGIGSILGGDWNEENRGRIWKGVKDSLSGIGNSFKELNESLKGSLDSLLQGFTNLAWGANEAAAKLGDFSEHINNAQNTMREGFYASLNDAVKPKDELTTGIEAIDAVENAGAIRNRMFSRRRANRLLGAFGNQRDVISQSFINSKQNLNEQEKEVASQLANAEFALTSLDKLSGSGLSTKGYLKKKNELTASRDSLKLELREIRKERFLSEQQFQLDMQKLDEEDAQKEKQKQDDLHKEKLNQIKKEHDMELRLIDERNDRILKGLATKGDLTARFAELFSSNSQRKAGTDSIKAILDAYSDPNNTKVLGRNGKIITRAKKVGGGFENNPFLFSPDELNQIRDEFGISAPEKQGFTSLLGDARSSDFTVNNPLKSGRDAFGRGTGRLYDRLVGPRMVLPNQDYKGEATVKASVDDLKRDVVSELKQIRSLLQSPPNQGLRK